jgi:transglutaminase-like putative cysteine protease
MANVADIILGLAGIALGLSTASKGVERLSSAIRGVPTSYGRTKPVPPIMRQGRHVQTASGPMRTTLHAVESLDDRIAAIAKKANEGKTDPRVIAWARRELSKKCRPGWNGEQWCVPEKDTEAEINAIFKALRRDIRYTSDVLGVDTYAHPRRTLEMRGGDCDEYSATACAALMSVGIPCRFKVIRTKDASSWNHIYVQGGTPKNNPTKWISLDASVPVKPGWEAPASMVAEARIYPAY